MSLWRTLTAGGRRRTLGLCVTADGVRRVALHGERIETSAPRGAAAEVSVAAVADADTLLRRLSLPPAKPAVTDRLVRQQVAAMLPGMDDQLVVAWRRDPQGGGVTVAAGPRGALRTACAADEAQDADLRVPFGLALDALLTAGRADPGSAPGSAPASAPAPEAWAVDCGPVTWLLIYAGGALVAADSVAGGPADAPVDTPATDTAAGVFADLVAGLPADQRPARLTWVGRGGAPPADEPGRVHVAASDFPAPTGWTGGGDDAAAWLAAGAALVGRQAREVGGIEFAPAPADSGADPNADPGADPSSDPRVAAAPARRRVRRPGDGPAVSGLRWAAVGLWLVAALGFWAWAVASGGARQSAVVDELGLDRAAIPGLDRGLAVGRYLETSGPSLVAVLDELGQKTGGAGGGWLVDELTWERDAGLTLRGTLPSADALAKLARTMATMRTLSGVQVRRQTPAHREAVSYTLVASPASTWFGAFVEPPKTDAAPESEESDPGATRASESAVEPKSPEKPPAAAEPDATSDSDPVPAAPAPQEEAAEVQPRASGPITSIDDPRIQALLEKYPMLRDRAEQMAERGVSISEAQLERLERSLESRRGNR